MIDQLIFCICGFLITSQLADNAERISGRNQLTIETNENHMKTMSKDLGILIGDRLSSRTRETPTEERSGRKPHFAG